MDFLALLATVALTAATLALYWLVAKLMERKS
jgi:hypothetical protein